MKKQLTLIAIGTVILAACGEPAVNPDPNHTHADFEVWVQGQKLDFSGEEFMSVAPVDGAPHAESSGHHAYLHLHDKNGDVIHRHKPGLSVLEFLGSIGVKTRTKPGGQMCFTFPQRNAEDCEGPERWFLLFVNGMEDQRFLNDDYVFSDIDKLLITDSQIRPNRNGSGIL